MLEKAILIAVNAHSGQTDKAGTPYILHPIRLMMHMQIETDRIVAVLHDVPEDSDYTIEQFVSEGFGEEIINALDCLCKRENETYENYIRRIKPNPLACRIKLADLQDNMNILRMNQLTEVDLNRIKKYHAAWQELKSTQTSYLNENIS